MELSPVSRWSLVKKKNRSEVSGVGLKTQDNSIGVSFQSQTLIRSESEDLFVALDMCV